MLTAKRIDTFNIKSIYASLSLPEVSKLIIVNSHNDVLVYHKNQDIFKHLQTYPNLIKHLHTDESRIYDLKYSHSISTIFAQCDKTIILLNSSNLSQYDYIFEKRGIEQTWVFNIRHTHTTDDYKTILLYSTKTKPTLRALIWEGTTYKKMIDVPLFHKSEKALSALAIQEGILISTKHGIYLWKHDVDKLIKIDKITKRTAPDDMMVALNNFKNICEKESQGNNPRDIVSNKSISSKASEYTFNKSRPSSQTFRKVSGYFWQQQKFRHDHSNDNIRYIFKPSEKENPIIFDFISRNILELHTGDDNQHFLVFSDCNCFNSLNEDYFSVKHIDLNVVLLYNEHSVKFIEYEQGFPFLNMTVDDEIKDILLLEGPYFVMITKSDDVHLYHYQVDDSFEQHILVKEFDFNTNKDKELNQLWRNVLFYKYFLSSTYSLDICVSSDPEHSLDLCAMKLRDLTVVLCLRVFERYQYYLKSIEYNEDVIEKSYNIQRIIVENIFKLFITYWAPPHLVLLKTLPNVILAYVMDHLKHYDDDIDAEYYSLPDAYTNMVLPKLILHCYVPYLIEIRRHIKNIKISKFEGNVTWKIFGRKINQTIDFFLVDDDEDTSIVDLLTLLDTSLFEIYFNYNKALIGPFLRVENYAKENVVISQLKKNNMFQELIDCYFQSGKHKEALNFLKTLYLSLSSTDEQEIKDGILLLIIGYLRNVPNDFIELIFDYTKWVLDIYHDKESVIILVFMQDTLVSKGRDYQKVYNFIKSFDAELAVSYLEFTISSFQLTNATLQSILIKAYIANLSDAHIRKKFNSLLKSSMIYEPKFVLKILDDSIREGQNMDIDNLNYLQFLKIYPLYKLREDNLSVSIVYNKLHNYAEASKYCLRIYREDMERGQSVILYFLQQILKLPASDINENEDVLYFLKEFGSKLNTKTILKLMPPNTNIKIICDYLLNTIETTSLKVGDSNLERSLLQLELINTTNTLNVIFSENYLIKETDICSVCDKKFPLSSNDSVSLVNIYGKSKIVHTTCAKVIETHNSKSKVNIPKLITVGDYKDGQN
ncbi:hypothetical protein TPHA_0B02090 [Tetrapisispora phaffii CBS 4417]|uniref:Vacuolar sorting protein 39/Transforming growth factor beta receptor-associated domain-containing protein n=1 Tax=Tetrapisispora phaffii (strain ATCC 24235 / CBS 4417 / NBRC 1672 / NRRL Y-8282 / UCD 70-5) TaxID=1071381 RepID=G8BPF0_TETPH|nr:hypothetical protein TPHA_0B02090 [Tetrapisispora phaffii CBS 4417]CCE61881.1 hypothetical protein TPHA_0B02090 [Tetrapisispora phaffii CBS 4417]